MPDTYSDDSEGHYVANQNLMMTWDLEIIVSALLSRSMYIYGTSIWYYIGRGFD